MTARLASVDRHGRVTEVLGRIERQVTRLRSVGDRSSTSLPFSFEISAPGLYRIEITFQDRSGKRLVRYAEYARVVRPHSDVHLTLNATSFLPGETLTARLENYGTDLLSYGLDYTIESFDGAAWTRSAIGSSGFVPAIGLATGPGMAASCWKLRIPDTAPPGLYRFIWSGESHGKPFPARGTPLTLTAEFQILAG